MRMLHKPHALRLGNVVRFALAALLFASTVISAQAEEYPNRIIRIINPFPAGGSTDILSRSLAQRLTESLGQSVIVETRPGANGIIGAGSVAKSAPDGYTFLLTTGSHTANPHVAKDLPYDAIRDFAPITQIAGSYGLALVTNLKMNSVAELVELGKQRQLTYATSGLGNLTHVAGKVFESRAGLKMIAVPYNTPTMMTDVISGTVDITFLSTISAVPLVNTGRVKALAITGTRRSPGLPNAPTLQELGFKDFDLTGYFGTMFPANTPRDRVEKIAQATREALKTSDLKRAVEDAGLFVVGSTPEEFAAFLKKDYEYQGRLMEEVGMKVK